MKKILFFAFILIAVAGCKNSEYQKIEEELLTKRIKQHEIYERNQQQKHKDKNK